MLCVTYLPEDKCWYVTYVAYSIDRSVVALARTKDFASAELCRRSGATNDKDGGPFSVKNQRPLCQHTAPPRRWRTRAHLVAYSPIWSIGRAALRTDGRLSVLRVGRGEGRQGPRPFPRAADGS